MAKDYWETPWDVIKYVSDRFPLVLDVCTDGRNAKTGLFVTNSLIYDWHTIVTMNGGGYIWCNPPYSNPAPFTDKLIETVEKGTGSVVLVNAATSSSWFHRVMNASSEVWIPEGRIAFYDPDTGSVANGNDRSQCFFVLDPDRIGERKLLSIPAKEIQPCRKKKDYKMITVVEFDPTSTNRQPTGRYCRMQATRETLPMLAMMSGISLTVDEKGLIGNNLFVYPCMIPAGSDWTETPLEVLVNGA